MSTEVLEFHLIKDAFLGSRDVLLGKLKYLAGVAHPEQWNYEGENSCRILYNYLCFTYDRLKQEGKLEVSEDETHMCFNTGLLNRFDADIYCLFSANTNTHITDPQPWFLIGFRTRTDKDMQWVSKFPEIADYFTDPSDFIFDKSLPLHIDYNHIITDNMDRFLDIGLNDTYLIQALLENAVKKIQEKLKRNYKLAIPQFYTDKTSGQGKIQLLLPLFLKSSEVADLALVVDKSERQYVGKTILPLAWAYVNSRRIVKPDVDWLKI